MKRIVALLCILSLLWTADCTKSETITDSGSDTPPSGSTSAAGDGSISCMSFNVLAFTGSDSDYLKPEERLPAALEIIRENDADIVGVQEATEPYSSNNFDWWSELGAALSENGYANRALVQEDDCMFGAMPISAGLVIFYKEDRFEVEESGCFVYTVDSGRYYQWVKLYDKENDKKLFVINTHLSISNGDLEGGNRKRLSEAEELRAFWDETVDGAPFFCTGDYNCYAESDPLVYLENGPYAPSYAMVEPEGATWLDYCFFNKEQMDVEDYAYISNEFTAQDGNIYKVSDHHPVMTYARYK